MIIVDNYLTEIIDSYRITGKVLIIDGDKIHVGLAPEGFYDIPGGGVHKNETPMQGAIRECLEEIGVKVKNIKSIDKPTRFLYYKPGEYKGEEVHFFTAEFDIIDKSKYGNGPEGKRKHVIVPISKVIEAREKQMIDSDDKWFINRSKHLIKLLKKFI